MDKAAQCLRVQAALQPGNCDPFLNLGGFYHATGMIEEAIDAYLEGLAICPEDEYICHNLANLMAEIGETSKAEFFLNRAILANPTRGINYWTRGNFFLERGNYDAAITYHRYALNLMAEDVESAAADMQFECRLHLVEAYFGKGMVSQGLAVLETVDWPDGNYRQRAVTLRELGYSCLDGTENPPPNSYTRERALTDGMIIDITEQARSLGFKYPTAVTRAIWQEIITPPHFKASTEGERISIILLAVREAIARGATGSFIHFTLILPLIDGDEAEFPIIAACHPGDQGEPVITIMFQDEDEA